MSLKLNNNGKTADGFKGAPNSRVTAGLTGFNNRQNTGLMFFGGQMADYDWGSKEFSNVKSVSAIPDFPLGSSVTAACMVPGSNSDAYLFNNNQYCRYDVKNWKKKSDAKSIRDDFGGASRITAAILTEGNNIMLVSGKNYQVWNPNKKSTVKEGSCADVFPGVSSGSDVHGSFTQPRGGRPPYQFIFNDIDYWEFQGHVKP